MSIDPRAATGFGSAAERYERGRPSYAPEAVLTAVRALGLTSASTVLDLAAGTGKLTRLLTPLVERVVAVDPSASMLAVLREHVPTVTAILGSAEAIPLEKRSVGAVFVGEAFHWFQTAPACEEIVRVLMPGGGLALLWNRSDWSEQKRSWLGEFVDLIAPHREAAGPFPAGGEQWRTGLEATGLFEPLSTAEFDHVQRLDVAELEDLVASWTWIANLDETDRAEVLASVRRLVAGRDHVELPYTTSVTWTRVDRSESDRRHSGAPTTR